MILRCLLVDDSVHFLEAASRLLERQGVAVVGVGYWGPNIVRNLANAPGFELASVCDRRVPALEATAARYPHVHCTTSFEEILNDASIDAVAIATPHNANRSMRNLLRRNGS